MPSSRLCSARRKLLRNVDKTIYFHRTHILAINSLLNLKMPFTGIFYLMSSLLNVIYLFCAFPFSFLDIFFHFYFNADNQPKNVALFQSFL